MLVSENSQITFLMLKRLKLAFHPSVLDDEQENRALLYKIPDFCHSRWSRKVAQSIEDGRSYPSFSEICKFICIEAEVVNNPITCIKSSGSSQSNCHPRSQQSQGSLQPNYGSRSYQQQGQSSHCAYLHAAYVQSSS